MRRLLYTLLGLVTLLSTSCSGAVPAPTTAPATTTTPASASTTGNLPHYYPADYNSIVEASKNETQGLLVWSNIFGSVWQPAVTAFRKQYPWIKLDIKEDPRLFGEYSDDPNAAGITRHPDILVNPGTAPWQRLLAKQAILGYISAEDAKLPAWSKLAPGIYAISSDPHVLLWNTAQVAEPPKSVREFAALIERTPGAFQGKVATWDATIDAAPGFDPFWFWIKKHGEGGWAILETIGQSKPFTTLSGSEIVAGVVDGAQSLGLFSTFSGVAPRLPADEAKLGWTMSADGTPVSVRRIAIDRKAASPNAAKLFLDFMLSAEGQLALSSRGLTTYRPDIAGQAQYHLSKLAAEIGESNLIIPSLDPDLNDQARVEVFLARWQKAIGE